MNRIRRTKIIVTLGPAIDDRATLKQLIQAGVDVVRLNFSHGNAEDHQARATMVSELAAECGRTVAILGDLQGPKIRVARFKDGKISLAEGDTFTLDADLDAEAGDAQQVGIDYKELPRDCQVDDLLLLDDGRIVLQVEFISGQRIQCRVTVGGTLSNNKGINHQGGGLSAPAQTDKNRADILTAAKIGVDYVAVSFPREAADMNTARKLLQQAGCHAGLVAKIECAETMADAETLDGVQKRIIACARRLNRAVISATQMIESMISSPLPTRAEVMDVANSVLDGIDAVMCSAETAAGEYPVKTVEAMVRVILRAERERSIQTSGHRLDQDFSHIDESIAMAPNNIVDNIFPTAADIPAEFPLGDYQEQREYLVGGKLQQWEGEVNPIASPVCLNKDGKIALAIIGATPLLDGDTAMQALQAAMDAYQAGHGEWPAMSVADRIAHVERFLEQMREQRVEVG